MMRTKIATQKEALSLSRNAIENAAVRGPWVNVTVHLEEGELKIICNTWEFPRCKIDEVVELIKKDLASERLPEALVPDPLPEVDLEMIRTIPMMLPSKPLDEPKEVPATPDSLVVDGVQVNKIDTSNVPLHPLPDGLVGEVGVNDDEDDEDDYV